MRFVGTLLSAFGDKHAMLAKGLTPSGHPPDLVPKILIGRD
jgi:hypothetical protein